MGEKVTHLGGGEWGSDQRKLSAWCNGVTGLPLVDANMREMQATGFMCNRGRHITCSFLARDLGLDWRLGAEFFESSLIDYDVTSNWGNWLFANAPQRGHSHYNVLQQSLLFDADGTYIKLWCPELAAVPPPFVHQPWTMTAEQQAEFNCKLGEQYPRPIAAVSLPDPVPAAGARPSESRVVQNKRARLGE